MQLPAVFRRSNTLLLLEHAAEVLGILETKPIRHLRHGFTGCQSILGKPDNKPTDVVAGRISGGLLDDITEIIGRQAQLVGTILHGRQTEGELLFVLEIVTKQTVETDENVGILHLAGQELPVVEPLAEVKHQFDVAHENGILELVRFLTQLVLYLAHERHKYVMLLIGHVQGLIDLIFKKGRHPGNLQGLLLGKADNLFMLRDMKKITGIIALVLAGSLSTMAQTTTESMNRIETCKDNYRTLFGSEALTGQGTDPEMMDILQKFIFGEVFQTGKLTMKQREMITCITLATMQTLPQLKAHAGAALNVGVTPEELREVMYLTAPFIGFPKMLNAVATVNDVLKKRGIPLPLEKQGTVTEETRHVTGKAIQDKLYPGGIASVMEGLPDGMGKDVERFLTDYFFGEIYSRGAIDLQTRELLGYCVLTTLEAESQLQSHYHGNINVGNAPETLTAAVIQCLPYIGFPAAIKALRIIKQEYARPVSAGNNLVRLSKITVDAAQLDAYNAFLKEEIEASMRLEPGVLTLYATAEKDNPYKMTILEIYADRAAYESHLKTPHFQKYKQGTLSMVKELELVDVKPLIPGLKIK